MTAVISLSERRIAMSAVVGAIVSALGAYFGGMDFCTLYTFVSMGITIYEVLSDHTNDKTALR